MNLKREIEIEVRFRKAVDQQFGYQENQSMQTKAWSQQFLNSLLFIPTL